ncbi:hypothetical protein RhiirA5_436360 [Rhizophagus irregularis]|uniref:Uncharacterized protein n=1 Tax=Rhizophagus irregularis TaxID=588596 RepID=A0A2N0NM65_9GLOM|nr:hypothetical protein RhiirA5_436360 [Rhizophagus irregularis]
MLFDWFVKQKLSSTSTSSRQSKRTIVFNKSRRIDSLKLSTTTIRVVLLELLRNSLRILVKNKSIIPSEIVEKFMAKQRPSINKDFTLSNKENIDEEIVRRRVNNSLQKESWVKCSVIKWPKLLHTGLADALILLRYPWESDEARKLN